ncbi:hypothetical protein H632_c444p1, partial [Helicosporidium sp. ATCC 50920]
MYACLGPRPALLAAPLLPGPRAAPRRRLGAAAGAGRRSSGAPPPLSPELESRLQARLRSILGQLEATQELTHGQGLDQASGLEVAWPERLEELPPYYAPEVRRRRTPPRVDVDPAALSSWLAACLRRGGEGWTAPTKEWALQGTDEATENKSNVLAGAPASLDALLAASEATSASPALVQPAPADDADLAPYPSWPLPELLDAAGEPEAAAKARAYYEKKGTCAAVRDVVTLNSAPDAREQALYVCVASTHAAEDGHAFPSDLRDRGVMAVVAQRGSPLFGLEEERGPDWREALAEELQGLETSASEPRDGPLADARLDALEWEAVAGAYEELLRGGCEEEGGLEKSAFLDAEAQAAAEAAADAAMEERLGLPILRVSDSQLALARLAAAFFGHPSRRMLCL